MKKTRIVNINAIFIIIVVFIFAVIIFKLTMIGLDTVKVKGVSLSKFASSRNTKKEVITAPRGTIYSSDNEVLAKDVNSYTVIAYLDSSRTTDSKNPHHVVDKEMTAEKLSPLINMTKEKILEILNTKLKSCTTENDCTETIPYQVELGPGGRGITELVKDEIDDLGLPGIDFVSSTKRYYPNGDFLSYTLGYARMSDKNAFVGEMGLELSQNDELTGTEGEKEYQADVYGYQITSSPTIEVDAISGNDIYLTIDTNIQMFTEGAMTKLEEANPEWATISVLDAKTGEILGVASSPSFNNNTLEIKSYYDPFISYEYEPGSVMKIFSFMASMENGMYDGSAKYKSGSLKVDDVTIKDWNKYGWGTITFDEGFMGSSNVAASSLALSLGRAKLKDFYNALGFGEAVDIGLPNQMSGVINFKYNSEIASSSYGQGISVTAIQMLEALTVLSNDGVMIRPYIIKKIVNSSTGEIVKENSRTEVKKVASHETVQKMISLMRGVIDGSASMSTGKNYYLQGYDLIGKTGTAEIASSSGGYLSNTYVRSFAGVFPGEDPQIIIYVAASKTKSSASMTSAVKGLVQDISTYLNIYGNKEKEDALTYTIDSYINKETEVVSETITNNGLESIIIGNGTKIIKQYPSKDTVLNVGSKVFLLTNNNEYTMPNIKDWSRSDTEVFANLINLKVTFDGYGYVKDFSIKAGDKIDEKSTLTVTLEPKYKSSE